MAARAHDANDDAITSISGVFLSVKGATVQIRPPIAPPLAPAPAPQPDGSTPPPAPAAPAQAPTPSATLSQLPLPPQLALQLQRHEQPPEQRKYTSDCDHDCDHDCGLCDPGSSRHERCELQWGDPAHWVRRPDGSRVWVTPPIPLVPIGPNPGKPPSPGNSNDGMPGGRFEDLDPVVIEDSRDPPPSRPSLPLPFDAFPPDHGGGAGGGGPAPEGTAPASPAQPCTTIWPG